MVDLNKLPAPALRAAMATGTESWGSYGSALTHQLYVLPLPYRGRKGRRMCGCGCRKMATHYVAANGVGLASGCEMQAHRSLKALSQYRNRK